MLEDIEQEITEKVSIRSLGLKFGMVYGLVMIIYSIILNISGLMMNPYIGYLTWVIIIGMVIWVQNEYKANNRGFMSYSEGLGLGVILIGVGAVINSIFGLIYMTLIDPNFIKNMLVMLRETLEKQQTLNDEQIDRVMKFYQVLFQPQWMFLFGLIFTLFFGTLISAIVTLFTRKSNPDPFS